MNNLRDGVATVVLASASRTRQEMLQRAGLETRAEAAGVDEDAIKHALLAEAAPAARVAMLLAEAKALAVSARHAGALVIGADQVLVCGGRLYDKPADLADARASLEALSGRSHDLISAVAVARDGAIVWRASDRATLTMRDLSPGFIADYLARTGEAALSSVGAYQLEGLGAQLFARVDGDFFTILGLPLLPLLGFLRGEDVLAG